MRESDHQIGLHGLALLRAADPGELAWHREAIRALLASADSTPRALRSVGPAAGYAAWAASYDAPGNRLVAAEEPAVRELLARLAPGVAVDAGCGTGRHAAHLASLGHAVIGVDASPEMLLLARERVPAADFRTGDLRALPVEDDVADLVVCALALSHLPDLDAVGELTRVLKPGGTLVLSNPHPFATGVLGARAWCRTPEGERVEVPEVAHPVGAYLDAFTAHGLTARRCLEPPYGPGDGPVAGLPAAIVWEARR